MNIKNRPLLIAAGIALVIHILLSVIGTASSVLTVSGLTFDPTDPNSAPNPMLMNGIMALSLGLCCVSAFIDVGTGALYAHLHNKQEPIVLQDGLAGGAAAGAMARAISAVVAVLLNLLITPLLINRATEMMNGATMPPDALGAMMGLSVVSGLVGGGVNFCFALVTGSVLGAVGGGVVASLNERRQDV